MRFGSRRGTPLALALATTLTFGLALAGDAAADGFSGMHVMPGYVPAYDFTTGQQYQALPIPYGHYAKDPLGGLGTGMGMGMGMGGGSGLFHHSGNGSGVGGGDGSGLFHHSGNGSGCEGGDCGSPGGGGHGWFGKGCSPCSQGVGCGFLGKHKCSTGPCGAVTATGQAPSAQAMVRPSVQSACGQPGCRIGAKHGHLSNMFSKSACGNCGGRGCGSCGGSGSQRGCGLCGGRGCGSCGGSGSQGGCGLCGGRGCGSCLSGLKDSMRGKFAGMMHKPKIKWFLGAGGPVPITPGYVPYVVSTRSPREFFAFAPMNPDAP